MLVDDDLRLFARSPEAVADKIHLRLDYSKVVLRPALQHKT